MRSNLIDSEPFAHFRSAPSRQVTETSERRIWLSRCRQFRVVQSRCRYGPSEGPKALPLSWRVERFEPTDQLRPWGGWRILSTHSKPVDAFQAAEKIIKAEGRRQKAE